MKPQAFQPGELRTIESPTQGYYFKEVTTEVYSQQHHHQLNQLTPKDETEEKKDAEDKT